MKTYFLLVLSLYLFNAYSQTPDVSKINAFAPKDIFEYTAENYPIADLKELDDGNYRAKITYAKEEGASFELQIVAFKQRPSDSYADIVYTSAIAPMVKMMKDASEKVSTLEYKQMDSDSLKGLLYNNPGVSGGFLLIYKDSYYLVLESLEIDSFEKLEQQVFGALDFNKLD